MATEPVATAIAPRTPGYKSLIRNLGSLFMISPKGGRWDIFAWYHVPASEMGLWRGSTSTMSDSAGRKYSARTSTIERAIVELCGALSKPSVVDAKVRP